VSSADLHTVVTALANYQVGWSIAGGWAIDLFLDRTTRPHADVDVAVFRDEQDVLRTSFPEWDFQLAIDGKLVPWEPGRRVDLPLHEIHATSPAGTIEFLLNERHDDRWVYRRDSRIERPMASAILRSATIPILAPEIVLLYKSKNSRTTDEADLASVAPHMSAESRQWLASALQLSAPGHPWIDRLAVTR